MIQQNQIPKDTNQRSASTQSKKESLECHSSKTATHFSIPEQNQNQKRKPIKFTLRQKTSTADKQFKKLNKQLRNVKSLEQEYRELEDQLMDIKQMVKIQLKVIGCSGELDSKTDTSEQNIQRQKYCNQRKNNGKGLKKQHIVFEKSQKIDTTHLQTIITSLFSYNDTIQAANSNYLLLSQVKKQQESQTLFHINNLEERIRQLRFLLNGKEDLLAYQLATLYQGQNSHLQDDQPQQVIINYHLPRRIALTNQNSMQCEFRAVQKAMKEITKLRQNVETLQGQLHSYEKEDNNKENQENYEITERYMEKKRQLQQQEGYQTLRAQRRQIQSFQQQGSTIKPFNQFHNNLVNPFPNQTQTKPPGRSISRQDILIPTQLMLLPLSIFNSKSSLIYRVGKLEQIEKQRKQDLNKVYSKLLEVYQDEMKTKRTLMQEYQIKRDVYAYKKKQMQQNQSKKIWKEIAEGQEEQISQNEVNLEKILQQIHDQEESEGLSKDQANPTEQSTIIQVLPSTLINVKPSNIQHSVIQLNQSLTSTSQNNTDFLKQESLSNLQIKEEILFNEIINSINIPKKKIVNPFLKLKDQHITRKYSSQAENDLLAKQSNGIYSAFSYNKREKENLAQRRPQETILNTLQSNNSAKVDQSHCNKLQICNEEKQLNNQQFKQANDVQGTKNRTPRRGRRELTRKRVNQNRQNQRESFQICN